MTICIEEFQIVWRSSTATDCKDHLANIGQAEPASLTEHWSDAWPPILTRIVSEAEGMCLLLKVGQGLGLEVNKSSFKAHGNSVE